MDCMLQYLLPPGWVYLIFNHNTTDIQSYFFEWSDQLCSVISINNEDWSIMVGWSYDCFLAVNNLLNVYTTYHICNTYRRKLPLCKYVAHTVNHCMLLYSTVTNGGELSKKIDKSTLLLIYTEDWFRSQSGLGNYFSELE